MPSPEALAAVIQLLRRGGWPVSEAETKLLQTDGASLGPEANTMLAQHLDAALRGFFHAAAEGATFTNLDRIPERFGSTLEANYPEAGPSFLKLARSYWTLKLIVGDPAFDGAACLADSLLGQIERMVGSLFFPMPGPIQIDPRQREATQRAIIEQSGAPIDVEELIRHNPILIRDRKSAGGGCAGVLIVLLGFVSACL